jgi:hypothetical protein
MDDNVDLPLFYHYTSLAKLKKILRAGMLMDGEEVKKDKFLRKTSYCSTLAPSSFSKSEIISKHRPHGSSTRNRTLKPEVCLVLVEKHPNLLRSISDDGLHFSFRSHKKNLFRCIQTIFIDDSLDLKSPLVELIKLLRDKHSVDILPLEFAVDSKTTTPTEEAKQNEVIEAPEAEAQVTSNPVVSQKEGGLWNWILGIFSVVH